MTMFHIKDFGIVDLSFVISIGDVVKCTNSSYFNIYDKETGLIKPCLQISSGSYASDAIFASERDDMIRAWASFVNNSKSSSRESSHSEPSDEDKSKTGTVSSLET